MLFLCVFYLLCASAYAYRPVVIWHGMGDTCCSEDSMGRMTVLLHKYLGNDTFVHSVRLAESADEDRKASYFGQINLQVDNVCQELATIPELQNGYNAIGFSQGGLLLRTLLQRCNLPRMHRLITFGSPHGGVSDIPNCMNQIDPFCGMMRFLVRSGAYSEYAQKTIIPTQYYRDPLSLLDYTTKCSFLPYNNNELQHKDSLKYKENMVSLEKLILIRFVQEEIVKPAHSAWFWILNENAGLVPLEDQALYVYDWLGLRELNETGRLEFLVAPGRHMQ
ncbi:alpha/beta-hydrolase [Rhizopus microsporus]